MRILHTSDLHIGRSLNGYSLIEDQKYFLNWLLKTLKEQKVDALIISGDVYNSAFPSTQAVTILDEFLTEAVIENKMPVIMIAGNHDSPQRLGFSNRLLKHQGLHIAGGFENGVEQVIFDDKCGKIGITLLPYIQPATSRQYFPDEKVSSFDDAVEVFAKNYVYNKLICDVNILCAHGYYLYFGDDELDICESELHVGGSEAVNLKRFENFDYIALGHLHKCQKAGPNGRYSGSPLKYSISEENHKKQIVILDIDGNKKIDLEFLPVKSLRDVRVIKGEFSELLNIKSDDYISAELTDENLVLNAMAQLKVNMPNLLNIEYINRKYETSDIKADIKSFKDPAKLFEEFYESAANKSMSNEEKELVKQVMREVENIETD